MPQNEALRDRLYALDGQNYGAYKQLRGSYQFPRFKLQIDWVQADPFASPSRVRIHIPQAIAQIPPACYATRSRQVALRDFLVRQFGRETQNLAVAVSTARGGSGNSGMIAMASAGQAILARSAVLVLDHGDVEVRFAVGLPARGRRILGRQAVQLLYDDLPLLAERLEYGNLDAQALARHLTTAEDATWLRQQLAPRGLVAFVADGAHLPRQSGISDRPLMAAVPFTAPETLRVQFDRPHHGPITGMGIPQGISLIVGGGYHGKSTLLKAIAQGIYNHVPGDGREWVITDAGAVTLRAEEGRRVSGVNISPFIAGLPQGQSTTAFYTDNASGSTSQGASLIEALEVGATALLLDEDTCATNFMIRDRRMQMLIHKANEPITPLIDRVEMLYRDHGVSTLMVMGGSGAYFDVATVVIGLTAFEPQDLTQQAKAIAQQYSTPRLREETDDIGELCPRRLAAPDGPWPKKIKVRDITQLSLGQDMIDLRATQLVDAAQTRAVGWAMLHLLKDRSESPVNALPGKWPDQGYPPLAVMLDQLMAQLDRHGLDLLTLAPNGDLAEFRRFELAAALSRWRSLPLDPLQP